MRSNSAGPVIIEILMFKGVCKNMLATTLRCLASFDNNWNNDLNVGNIDFASSYVFKVNFIPFHNADILATSVGNISNFNEQTVSISKQLPTSKQNVINCSHCDYQCWVTKFTSSFLTMFSNIFLTMLRWCKQNFQTWVSVPRVWITTTTTIPFQTVVDEWIEVYQQDKDTALLQLMDFFFQCSGCRANISQLLPQSMDFPEIVRQLTLDFEVSLQQ